MRKAIPKEITERVLNRFGGRCGYCGEQPKRLQIDHMNPIVVGGTNDISNLMPACRQCSNLKLFDNVEEFRYSVFIRCVRYSVDFRTALRFKRVHKSETPIVFYFELNQPEGETKKVEAAT